MTKEKIQALVSQMTLEEKAAFCAGKDFWRLVSCPRLGIPEVMVSDGPHGLRAQKKAQDNLGINDSIEAVCFPTGCATGSSFDRNLVKEIGSAIGTEAQAVDLSVVLGPAMNIKRSPLCGRNFEYISEDPLLAGDLAAALIEGIQSKNIGTSPKHFAANSQEYHRMSNSSNIDERTLREIYLANFERAVKKAQPWTVMNSYNKINGTYTCEDKWLLTDVLRDEWGYQGLVETDWGAMDNRVAALKAGCDLEMPGPGDNRQAIIDAVQNGMLSEEILDISVARILDLIFKYTENRDTSAVFDYEKDHALAAKAAEQCLVLLKNDDAILPLKTTQKAAFIGQYAQKPRYQGGGSSHINSFRVESALEAAAELIPEASVTYARGFDDSVDTVDPVLIAEAAEAARAADIAVVFAGLPDSYESEGYDRTHLRMPMGQEMLIEAVAAANPNTVVVLHNGSAIEMPWLGKVKGVLEAYLGGQAVGRAEIRILYGMANPSGRLAESFPLRLEDTPCYLDFGGEDDEIRYSEGVFVGYRYYTSRNMPVLFPFGYGLSYTDFAYSDLCVSAEAIRESEPLTVSVDVTNTGNRAGAEVVQLYVGAKGRKPNGIIRPVRELRGFDKIYLEPGETRTVTFTLDSRAFAVWNTTLHDWYVDTREYTVEICANAFDVLLSAPVTVTGEKVIPYTYTMNSIVGRLMHDPKGAAILENLKEVFGGGEPAPEGEDSAVSSEMAMAMMEGMPLRSLPGFVDSIKKPMLEQLIDMLNADSRYK